MYYKTLNNANHTPNEDHEQTRQSKSVTQTDLIFIAKLQQKCNE
jgi:hypothetical protein